MIPKFSKGKNYSSFNLQYYVLLYNGKELQYYNIFNNAKVERELISIQEDHPRHEEVVERLASIFMYSFWSKCEYEFVITPWIGQGEDEKVDVWDQIYPNLELIANMVEHSLWG